MSDRDFPPPPSPLVDEGNFNVARYEEEQHIVDDPPLPIASPKNDEGKLGKMKEFFGKAKKPKLPNIPFFKKKKDDNVLQVETQPLPGQSEVEQSPEQRLTPPEQDSWSPGQPLLQRGLSSEVKGVEDNANASASPHQIIINTQESSPLDDGYAREDDKIKKPFREISRKPVRSSTVTLALLIFGIVVGILLTALSSMSFTLKVIGPTILGLSFFALIGKLYFTKFLNDDPDIGLRPLVEKAREKIATMRR